MARIRVSQPSSVLPAYAHASRVAARALQVHRVGIWMFEENRTVLRCVQLRVGEKVESLPDIPLLQSDDFPSYMAEVTTSRWVRVDDALNDPITKELVESYLRPLGITSMLDAPVLRAGEIVGVVCHEHVGPARVWSEHEVAFAGSVADVVALIAEQAERLTVEEALRARDDAERESDRLEALGRLAASVAHDVNNLLAAIDGLASVASRSGPLPEGAERAMTNIHEVTARGAALMKRLLAFGRGEPTRTGRVDIGAVVRALEVVLTTLVRGRCDLAITLPDEPIMVRADPSMLEQVLLNLALNARDAMPHGGMLQVSVSTDGSGDEQLVVLSVADEGTGMDEVTRSRVFEPYFTTKEGSGTGLGLSTVWGIAKQIGGRVEIESEVGKGSIFHLLLPCG